MQGMKERKCVIDILRAAATCAVVLLHTVTGIIDNMASGVYFVNKDIF